VVDVRRPDLDSVPLGVAHELGRGIEPHWLRVENGGEDTSGWWHFIHDEA